jgi:hypothetical protein
VGGAGGISAQYSPSPSPPQEFREEKVSSTADKPDMRQLSTERLLLFLYCSIMMILQDEKDSRGPTVILEEKEEAFRYSKMKEKNYNHLAMFGEESCVGYKISVMIFVKEEIRKEI